MKQISRYAVYYAPAPGPFAEAAARWLGRDPESGRSLPQPPVPVPDLQALTADPRRYGFHGTLKAPFRLAGGESAESLAEGLATLAGALPPVRLPGLRLIDHHGFLALVPDVAGPEELAPLRALAQNVVQGLEPFRAPLTGAETARRRPEALSPRQRELLARWGYPFTEEEFTFHLTLSGRTGEVATLMDAARVHFSPHLPAPFVIDALCLFGEEENGLFHLLSRVPLAGSEPSSTARSRDSA